MEERIPARLTAAEGRRFAFSVGAAFGIIAALLAWRDRPTAAAAVGIVAIALLVSGIVAPTRLGAVERAWMRLAHAISRITTPIVMGLLFYLVMTPFGLAMRLLGHRPLTRHRSAATAWVKRPPGARRSRMERQF